MATKFLFFALAALLFVQCAFGNAIGVKTQETVKDSSEEKSNFNDAGLEFFLSTMTGMLTLIEETYNASQAAYKPIIAEVEATGDVAKTEMQKKVADLKNLFDKIEKSEKEDDSSEKIDFLDELQKIFEGFETTGANSTAPLTEFDKKVLTVNESLKEELKKDFTTFADNLVTEAEKYWNTLSAEKKEAEKKFHEAFTQLKNEPDLEKRAKLLQEFIVFDDSSEEKN